MEGQPAQIFKDLVIAVNTAEDPELRAQLVKNSIKPLVEEAGGELYEWTDADKDKYTHVLASHISEKHALWAKGHGQVVASLLWLWESLESNKILPMENEELYTADILPNVPGARDLTVSTTGFTGFYRVIVHKMLSTLGLTVTKDMSPQVTTHVLAADLEDVTSKKLIRARSPDLAGKISIVNVLWLYDCLRQGCILSAGSYQCNPQEGMNPAKGALACDARLQTVAASDSSEAPSPRAGALAADIQILPFSAVQDPAPATAHPAQGLEMAHTESAHIAVADSGVIAGRQSAGSTGEGFQQQAGLRDRNQGSEPPRMGNLGSRLISREASRSGSPQDRHASDSPAVDNVEECSPHPPAENGWQTKKARRQSLARLLQPLVDIANSSPAIQQSAGTKSVPSKAPHSRFIPPRPAAQEQTPILAADSSAPKLGSGEARQSQQESDRALQASDAHPRSEAQPRSHVQAASVAQPRTASIAPRVAQGGRVRSNRQAGPEVQHKSPSEAKGEKTANSSPEYVAAGELDGAQQDGKAGSKPRALGSPDSYVDHSQQVAGADAAVGMLVGQLAVSETTGKQNVKDDDTEDELEAEGADSGKKVPQQGPQQIPQPAGSRAPKPQIPVNTDAPLASQDWNEDANAEEAGFVHGGHANCGTGAQPGTKDGVLWKALPIKRSGQVRTAAPRSAGTDPRGTKRKAAPGVEPFVGRKICKAFKQGTFKGTVASYDNDCEEMSSADLQPLLLPDTSAEAQGAHQSAKCGDASKVRKPATCAAHKPCAPSGQGADTREASKPEQMLRASRGCRKESTKQAASAAGRAAGKQQRQQPKPNDAEGVQSGVDDSPAGKTQAGKELQPKPAKRRKGNPARANQIAENPASEGRGAGKRRPVFAVSGMHSDEREAAAADLRTLGMGLSLDLHSHQWDSRITHVLLPSGWTRGAKVLSAMAAGAWLLSQKYLQACSNAHCLLEEDDFEITGNRKNTVSKGAPRHWRLKRKLQGRTAFQDLKVSIYGESEDGMRPRRDELVSILQAGKANVLTINQALNFGAHFVVTRASRPKHDAKIRQLIGAGLCIVSPQFVIDWVAFPWKLPAKHVLHGTHMGSDLTAAATARGGLQANEEARQQPEADDCKKSGSQEESQLY